MREANFDKYELLTLEAILSPSEVAMDKPGFLPPSIPSKELCLKVGSALTEALEKETSINMALSEAECWVLRERVSVFFSLGPRTDVGISIKVKLYSLLLEYANQRETGELELAPLAVDHAGRYNHVA